MGERDADEARRTPAIHRAHRADSAVRHQAHRDGIPASGGRGAVSIGICRFRSSRMSTASRPPDFLSDHVRDCAPLTPSRISRRLRRPIRCKSASARRTLIRAEFSGDNVRAERRFRRAVCAGRPAQADTLRVITERESAGGPGFFQAQALLGIPGRRDRAGRRSRRERSFCFSTTRFPCSGTSWSGASPPARRLCGASGRRDSFNLLLFNSELSLFSPQPRPATPPDIWSRRCAFIRNSRIRGGTDLQQALDRRARAARAPANRISC